jgi:hypothetical protein
VLALSGDHDLRTPTADAAALVSRFPRGRLLVAPGSGHSVLSNDVSGCAVSAVHDWLSGRAVAGRCRPQRPYLEPVPAFLPPRSVAAAPAGPARTLELVDRTLREAEATWLQLWLDDTRRAAGLHGGTLTSGDDSFVLSRYSLVPGVRVSGRVLVDDDGPPLTFSAVVTVDGAGASRGTAALHPAGKLDGVLGGRIVRR